MNKPIIAILAIVVALTVAACTQITPVTPAEPTQVQPTTTLSEDTTAVATPVPVDITEFGTATPDTRPTVPAPGADDSRPLAAVDPLERNDRFSGPAASYVAADTIYLASFITDKGSFLAELYQDTPESLNNFVTLALDGFYDGLTFHRVEAGFVAQGGDPAGDGGGGPGYTIPAEIIHTHPRGALAWARTSDTVNPERRSSGSQFYITLDDASFLDGAYTVFGYVVEGMDVVDSLEIGDTITRIDISESDGPSRLPTPTPTPEPKAPVPTEGRPLASLSLQEREGYYNLAPDMSIDTSKTYQAVVKTAKGEFTMDLDVTAAPNAVNNFVVLSNLGFYDGIPIAHVQADSYLVAGSPASQPASDVGYALAVEPSSSSIVTGTVSMYPAVDQTAGEVTASGSQFFIALAAAPDSETPLSIFGSISDGMDIVSKLEAGDIVESITIIEK